MVPNLGIFVISRKLAIRQIRGVDFRYDNIVFTFYPKIRKYSIFGPKFGIFVFFTKFVFAIFVFSPNFATRQIRGRRFQISQSYVQNPPQKYANQAFLVQNLRILILHQTLQSDKSESVDFKFGNFFFEFQSENTQLKQFLS